MNDIEMELGEFSGSSGSADGGGHGGKRRSGSHHNNHNRRRSAGNGNAPGTGESVRMAASAENSGGKKNNEKRSDDRRGNNYVSDGNNSGNRQNRSRNGSRSHGPNHGKGQRNAENRSDNRYENKPDKRTEYKFDGRPETEKDINQVAPEAGEGAEQIYTAPRENPALNFTDESFKSDYSRRYTDENFGIIGHEDDSILDSMPPDPTLDSVFADVPQPTDKAGDEGTEIVGIRFLHGGKTYYFAPGDEIFHVGDHAIVETARGVEFGDVTKANCKVLESEIVQPLRQVVRRATAADVTHNSDNHRREDEAFTVCIGKIAAHKLDMKLVGAQYTFDNSKLIFYFTSAGRVDFRELVKDLASVFRTRIELRQIGIRDEAKMIGGWGVCGRKLCCSGFLPNFAQVSIRMAKEQGLSLNSSKISGTCGRLMCCLRFEEDTYEREIALMPPPDSVVKTADGQGVVTEIHPVGYTLRVKLDDKPDQAPKTYHLDEITVLTRAALKRPDDEEAGENSAAAGNGSRNGRFRGKLRKNGGEGNSAADEEPVSEEHEN